MTNVLVDFDELSWVVGGGQGSIELIWLEGGYGFGSRVVVFKDIDS